MNKGIVGFLAFSLGAAAGSVVAWRILKTKYEQIAQDEIDSVREVYARKEAELSKEESKEEKIDLLADRSKGEKLSVREYAEKLQNMSYTKYTDIQENANEEGLNKKEPYVISPDEFDEIYEYDTVTLLYYADGILTDEEHEIVEDVESTVGRDSLESFGEYDDDAVYVRNDEMKIDYEILRVYEDFYDEPTSVTNKNPHLAEG